MSKLRPREELTPIRTGVRPQSCTIKGCPVLLWTNSSHLLGARGSLWSPMLISCVFMAKAGESLGLQGKPHPTLNQKNSFLGFLHIFPSPCSPQESLDVTSFSFYPVFPFAHPIVCLPGVPHHPFISNSNLPLTQNLGCTNSSANRMMSWVKEHAYVQIVRRLRHWALFQTVLCLKNFLCCYLVLIISTCIIDILLDIPIMVIVLTISIFMQSGGYTCFQCFALTNSIAVNNVVRGIVTHFGWFR